MPTEYRLNLFLRSRERFVAVSSCAETLIASGGIWKSLDADQETESPSGDGTSVPSTDLLKRFQEEWIMPTQMWGLSLDDSPPLEETSTEMSLDFPSPRTHEPREQTTSGPGTAMGHQDSVPYSPLFPWGMTKSS